MAIKYLVALCIFGAANAGLLAPAAPLAYSTVTSEQQNTLRSYGNLAQVSSFSKTIDTPFSSVAKSDVRVSNPGLIASPLAYAPALTNVAAPLAYAAPAQVAYTQHAPLAYSAPAQVAYAQRAPLAYSAPAQVAYAQHAPLAYSAPAPLAYPSHGPVVAKVAAPGLLGVAYSAAPLVSHMSYSNGYGIAYQY